MSDSTAWIHHASGQIDINELVTVDIGNVIRSPREEPDCILPGLIRCKCGVLTDTTSSGLSMLGFQIAALVAAGADPWGLWLKPFQGNPRRVIYLSTAQEALLVHAVHSIGSSMPDVSISHLQVNLSPISLYGRPSSLGDLLRKLEPEGRQSSLLVVDAFDEILRVGSAIGAGSPGKVREALLSDVEPFSFRTGCSVVLVRRHQDSAFDTILDWQAEVTRQGDGIRFSVSSSYGEDIQADVTLKTGDDGVLIPTSEGGVA